MVSDKMDKTVVVAVDYLKPHPLYRKIIRKTNKFHAHDATNQCHIGDVVRIGETRPLSKTKRWRLSRLFSAARSISDDLAADAPESRR